MIGASACGPESHIWWNHWGHGRKRRQRSPWWASAMDDPRPRVERGEVRYLVLDAIAEQPRHGYQVIQHIEGRASGNYRPSPGVIYPTLQMLEELDHASMVEQEGRKAYAITEAGKQELAENQQAVDDFYERFEEEPWESYADDLTEMMLRVKRMVKAFRKGARRGRLTPSTIRAIRHALDDALEKIEEALGGNGK